MSRPVLCRFRAAQTLQLTFLRVANFAEKRGREKQNEHKPFNRGPTNLVAGSWFLWGRYDMWWAERLIPNF